MEEILQHWERELGRPLPRPVVLSGDICQPGFGLSEDDAAWVQKNCQSIIHSAAILEFYGKDRAGEPWRTNYGGTENMVNLCRDLGIRDIHYVSTAYVAGYQDAPVMEGSLDVGQSFRNDYEESKFFAEKMVRSIDFADHVTVYRPAVIAGDSRTGYTNTYHGIYLYLRLMAMMIPTIPPDADGKRPTPIRLRMTGDERRNIIPVEWVSAVMTRLFENQEARGLTFHIAPENPISSGNIIRYCGEFFSSKGVEFCGTDAKVTAEVASNRDDDENQWLFERIYRENMQTYAPYERTDNVFDMTNTKRFAGDLVCPEIDQTVMRRYIEYGNEDRWGKRRPESVEPAFDSEDYLFESPGSGRNTGSMDEQVAVGLDLTGPGGAQVTLSLCRDGRMTAVRGLPSDKSPVLTMPAEEFAAVLQCQGNYFQSLMNAWDTPEGVSSQELSELLLNCLQLDVVQRQAQPA